MKKYILLVILMVCCFVTQAQDISENAERWQISEENVNITGLALSPEGNNVAMICGKNQPLIIYDFENKKILQEIDVKASWLGYNVYYSLKGNYILLQQKAIETTYKKSKEGAYSIVDVNKGEVIQTFNKISDAKISPDETKVITLENGTIYFKDIQSGKIIKRFKPEDATNAVAISPDGKDIAVVKNPTKQEARMLASKNVSKKAIKAAAKYSHLITIYDAETFELKSLIPEFYENINLLFYTKNGEKLLSFNVGANSYVNVALANKDYEPIREGYLGRTTVQPEFGYNANNKFFAIATVEKAPSLNVYDVASGSMVDFYNTQMRVWKNRKKGIYAGSNTSFVFLPDNRHILIGYGNSLIKWDFNKSN